MHPKITVRKGQRLHIEVDEGKVADLFAEMSDEATALARQAVRKGGRAGRFRDDGSAASVEGEAPHTETGELMRSIGTKRRGDEVSFVATAKHAEVHEFGKRPFMKPALEEAIAKHLHKFAEVLKVRAV